MFPLASVSHAGPAEWLIRALDAETAITDETVADVVPDVFPAYARIYHLATRTVIAEDTLRKLQSGVDLETDTPMRWSEVAEENGRVVHPQMAWQGLTCFMPLKLALGRKVPLGPGDVWVSPPVEGTLSSTAASTVGDILLRHTPSPSRCWFAVWEGYGWTDDLPASASFHINRQSYRLFGGAIDAFKQSISRDVWGEDIRDREGFFQTANWLWPDDQAWCLATKFNHMTTYVGGSNELTSEFLDEPLLETHMVRPAHGCWGDPINPSFTQDPKMAGKSLSSEFVEALVR